MVGKSCDTHIFFSDETSLTKVANEFGERQNQLTLPVLGHYVAQSGTQFDKTMTNHCGMRCILSCDKPCDSYIEKDNECTLFSLADTDWSLMPSYYLLPRRGLDLKFMSLNKLYNEMDKLEVLGQEYLDGLEDSMKQCDNDGIATAVSASPQVLTIQQIEVNQGCTFMFANLVDDDKLVTMTLKEGFEVIH